MRGVYDAPAPRTATSPTMTESCPIHSMTAFGRREQRDDHGLLAIEIRSVNSRHLEQVFRLPDSLREREFAWRDLLRQRVTRGKVEVLVRHDLEAGGEGRLSIDQDLVRQLLGAISEIDQLARHAAPLNAADLLRIPGVLKHREVDQVQLHTQADALFAAALDDFVAMRGREGAALHALIEARLAGIATEVEQVRERLPGIRQHYHEKLRQRLADAGLSPDNERLEQELVLFAQKMDVAEELDRLLTHLAEIRRVLAAGGAVGRRLDFLMQELNREANTLGSKAVSTDSTLSSVQIKVLIEQMREQIQNLE